MDTTNSNDPIFVKLIEIESMKSQYKHEYRPLLWYGCTIGIVLITFMLGIIIVGILHDAYFSTFAGWTAGLSGILLIVLIVYFFLNYKEYGEWHGFRGIERLKQLISLREEIEDLQIQLTILETHKTQQLTPREQYKNQLPQLITQYQRQANSYRRLHYTFQIIIILLSLLVSGLTSGLTGLIGIFGKPWIAPILSLSVSFLTALTALFRFRDRGFNLQQTADSIKFEVSASELRIFDYKGLSDEKALEELSERVARLTDEQRKRQQQLEQSSETKHNSE